MKKHTQFKHQSLGEALPTLNRVDGDGGRLYVTPNGTRLPSVTTVLGWLKKDSLVEWRKKVGEEEANRISSKAARRGTKLHKVCENFLNNEEDYFGDSKDMGTLDLFNSIKPILEQNVTDIYALEAPLYSEHLGLAGTVDCIAKWNGKRSAIDFKTANKTKREDWIHDYFMQCACYAVMFEERTGISVPQLVVLIAVDNDSPQVFIKKRDEWIDKAKKVISEYQTHHQVG